MTFSELKTRVLADAWPLGAPENLEASLNGYVLSGLIEIQRLVKCFRYRHDDVYDQCRTYWHNGATVIGAPRGEILGVYTVDDINGSPSWTRPVRYRAVPLAEFRRWQAAWRSRWTSSMYVAPPDSGLPLGFAEASAESDATCGRALAGIFALEPTTGRLYVGPWLQSTEKLIVEWRGIKREWSDGDLVPGDEDFIRLVRLWTEREYGRKWASSDLSIREASWREALADMMITCERESRLHGEPVTADEANAAEWAAFTPEQVVTDATVSDTSEATYKVIAVGDTGHADSASISVADAIIAEEPDHVLLVGDVKYSPNAAAAALAPYQTLIDDGKVKAALGNHDLDDGELGADVRAYVANPGNGRYFSYAIGPLSIFVADSGINSAGGVVEPDGNWEGSRQYAELAGAILRDTNPWKILFLHHPPYTSSANYYPGTNAVRWTGKLPVHAVVSAHSHQYERITFNGRTFIVAGTGGAELYDFRTPLYPGSQAQVKEWGYLRISVGCDSLTLEFVNVSGTVRDTITFTGTPVLPTPTYPLDPYITIQPASQAVAYNSPVTLSVTAVGTFPMSYQWTKDGATITGATSSSYVIDHVISAGTYRCLVSNSKGSTLSDAALVLVVSGMGTTVPNLTIFRAGDYTGSGWIILLADVNGDPGYFTPGGTGTDDGLTEIIDSVGNHFTRVEL